MNQNNEHYPAIILGVGITALGVMRGLGKYGISTYCVDEKIDFVKHCRYYKRPAGVELIKSAEQLPDLLRKLEFEKAVLMPCGDQWSRAIVELDDDLRARFPASAPSREVWNRLTDKALLADFLIENEVPHPRSIELNSESDLAQADSLFPGEWFIKPRDSERFYKSYWVKAYDVSNVEDLREKATQLFKDGHSFILQEYIPGPPSNHIFIDGFIDRDHSVKTVFARRRLRMFPRLFGNSCYMVTIEKSAAEREIDIILAALKAANYRGIFSAEFKRDERDGTPRLLEINTRPWWYIWFAERCGLSIARQAYLDALEQEVPAQEAYAVGTYMVYPMNDLFACLRLMRDGKISIFRWIADWLKAKQAVFWIGDPIPSIVWFTREVYRTLRRRISRKKLRRPVPGKPNART